MEEFIVYTVAIVILSWITGRSIVTDTDEMFEGGGVETMLAFGGLCVAVALATLVSVAFLAFVADLGWINTSLTVICAACVSGLTSLWGD